MRDIRRQKGASKRTGKPSSPRAGVQSSARRSSTAPEAIGLSGAGPTPLFHQIFLVLREKIIDGSYPFGSFLAGEQQIAASYGVARITAKRALDELAAEGLVERQRGLGTRVTFKSTQHSVQGSVESLMKSLRTDGRNTLRIVRFEYIAATPVVAEALNLQPGAEVQCALRVRSANGRPYSLLMTYVPKDLGETFTRKDFSGQPLYALLEKAGVEVASAEQKFLATLADTYVAGLLDIQVGTPLLKIVRTIYDKSKRPVEHLNALFRPDVYQYRMVLTRNHETGWE